MSTKQASSSSPIRTVLVAGANGYIGSAVSLAFVRAGWKTIGLIRKPEAAEQLVLSEVIPIIGAPTDLGFLEELFQHTNTFDAIVDCSGEAAGYAQHFQNMITLVNALAEKSNENGVRPLVLWSSGCKDYGTTDVHGAPGLAPHTEESPLNPHPIIKERCDNCPKIFDYKHLFDGVVLRPTSVFGYSSSYYGSMFDYVAAKAATGSEDLIIPGNPNSIMHATHVDDCAEAYLALAEHPDRSAVSGQIFNISGFRYETLDEVANALAKEYGFKGGVKYIPVDDAEPSFPVGLHVVFSFSQWVGSEKIRAVTGWRDQRQLFSAGIHVYRLAYEATQKRNHENIAKVQKRMMGNFK